MAELVKLYSFLKEGETFEYLNKYCIKLDNGYIALQSNKKWYQTRMYTNPIVRLTTLNSLEYSFQYTKFKDVKIGESFTYDGDTFIKVSNMKAFNQTKEGVRLFSDEEVVH